MSFDLERPWHLAEPAVLRHESFGALAYHFGTRRLSFLKSPKLATAVRELERHASARDACVAAGVSDVELPAYRDALATLADSGMVVPRVAA